MNDFNVSVIVPVYRARSIGRAIDSLMAQSCPPAEILVVDDGSPDDLVAVLEPYRGRIRLLRKSNGGAASARNLGLDHAKSDLIAFLDADDYWEPHKLERQVAIFAKFPEVGLVASQFFHEEPGRPRYEPYSKHFDGRRFGKVPYDRTIRAAGEEVFRLSTRIWTSSVVIHRNALGSQRFDCGLVTAEDRDLWIRLVSEHPAYLISEHLATAVLETGSLSRTNINRDFGNMLKVVRRHADLLGSRKLRLWESIFFRLWAACLLGEGEPSEALSPAWNRLRREPLSAEGAWVFLKCVMLASAQLGRGSKKPSPAAPTLVASTE